LEIAERLLIVFTDGCAKGNPGPAGIGVAMKDAEGNQVYELSRFIGNATNNVAEYKALIAALEEAGRKGATKVRCMLDSELVVRQLKGQYRVRKETLKKLHARVLELAEGFESCTYSHVPREENAEADRLANRAIE